ncbi:MAG: class I SAM-dependent methyltransferase [Tepidisphaeraceae bacterium]
MKANSNKQECPPSHPGGDVAAALRCYRDESLFLRLFTRGRHWLCPMRQVARHVPLSARVLDVGCGFGLFANLLATGSPQRRITGVEPDPGRLVVARRSSSDFPQIDYVDGLVQDIRPESAKFDVVTILDVLYLLPDDLKMSVLRHVRSLMRDPASRLLLKTNDTRPFWKYAVVRAEEWLMVQALAFTHGGQIHFRGQADYLRMLREAGFEAEVHKIDGWRPVPHRLFVARPV